MTKFIQKFFKIHEGDERNVFLMFSYIFLIIASLLIVKPVRNSLFLTKFGVSQLPYAFILVAVSAGILTNLFSKFAFKIRLNILIYYTTLISIFCLVIFWVLLFFNFQQGWFYYVIYVWVALFGVIATSQFWLLANYVFNAREAKRLFGIIGAGAILGGIFGGYLTNFLAPILGTANMLFFCIFFLFLCIYIMKYVWKRSARYTYRDRIVQEKRLRKRLSRQNIFEVFLKSRHLLLMASIVGVGVIVANLVDFQFSAIASNIIKDGDKLTAFFGLWLSNLSIASFLIQVFLTGRSLQRLGVITSLFFLPIGVLIGAASVLIYPQLWSAVVVKIFDGSFKQSINKSALELLALPIPSSIKYQGKTFIDVFVDSIATGIGGIILILFIQELDFSVQYISLLLIVLIGIWFYLLSKVKQEYINSFRIALEKRTIDLQDQNINIEDASVLNNLTRTFNEGNERQILYILQLIEDFKNEKFIPYYLQLIHHSSPDIRIQSIKNIKKYDNPDFSQDIKNLIYDESFDVQVEAISYVFNRSQNGKEILKNVLTHPDYKLKSAALLSSAYQYRDLKEFRKEFDIRMLFDQFVDNCYHTDYDKSEMEFMKIILAKIIGIAQVPEFYPFLKNLLYDNSLAVVRTAIHNAGITRDPIFIPILIRHLNTHRVRKNARTALVEYGNDVLINLKEFLSNQMVDRSIRIDIPKVFALIGTQESTDLLLENLNHGDLLIRHEIIRALNKLKMNTPFLRFDITRIKQAILIETTKFNNLLLSHHFLKIQFNTDDFSTRNKAKLLLMKAIEEKLGNCLERIFRLLGLVYSQGDIYNAYRAITSTKVDIQANALEFLDNILDTDLKKQIIPIIEYETLKQRDDLTTVENQLDKIDDVLKNILDEDDIWLKVCVLYYIAEMKVMQPAWMIKKFSNDPEPIVKETAQYALRQIHNSNN